MLSKKDKRNINLPGDGKMPDPDKARRAVYPGYKEEMESKQKAIEEKDLKDMWKNADTQQKKTKANEYGKYLSSKRK